MTLVIKKKKNNDKNEKSFHFANFLFEIFRSLISVLNLLLLNTNIWMQIRNTLLDYMHILYEWINCFLATYIYTVQI